MGIKYNEVEFRSRRTVQDLGRRLQDSLAGAKAASIEELESGSGALAQFDDRAEIEIVARGAEFTSMWAVQIYVHDSGAERIVRLVGAVGEGGLTRTFNGMNTNSLSKSVKKRDLIAQALK